jgi:hypothetical protein
MPYSRQLRDHSYTSPLSSISFTDVEPFAVSAAFQTIHAHLRFGGADAAENSINALRQAADFYNTATRRS